MSHTDSVQPGWTVSSILGDFGPQAFHREERIAIRWEHGSLSYGELRESALRLAGALQAMGCRKGDRVASVLFNRGEIFQLYFACAFAGLTFVPISFRLTRGEIASILGDCAPRVLFTEPDLSETVGLGIGDAQADLQVVELEAARSGAAFDAMARDAAPVTAPVAHSDHMILYTSGTTGRPKGVVMEGQAIVWCGFQQLMQYTGLCGDSVMMINAPMYNTAGINEACIPTFLTGGTVAIMPSRGWAADRWRDFVDLWGVTHCLVFPSMFRSLLELAARGEAPLGSLKLWYTGGENLPAALMEEVMRTWPHVDLVISYGSTESGLVTYLTGQDILDHPGSVGRCSPGQSIRLLDRDGLDVAAGEPGEIWTSGPAVMTRYWNAPELTAETVRDRWLKIGDIARMDDGGWYYIVGRSKDLIISKGQNIYPAEIENVLRSHPDVIDVAVVAVPDAEFGETVCAAIVARGGGTPGAAVLVAYVQEYLASYKKPRHVVFVDAFPLRNGTKVDKPALAAICIAELGLSEQKGAA